MARVIGQPAIPGFASGNWRLERSQSVAFNPFGKTRDRTEFDGAVWRGALGCPKYNDEDAAVFGAWLDQISEAENWLYISPPQNELRGGWVPAELVTNGTLVGGVTTGWTGTGAALSVNSRRLKVKNSGAAIGYARQTLTVTADVPYVLLTDLHPGNVEAWRIRLLDGADAEEHVSYYDKPGRVPIVHIPATTTLKLELGCNTAVSGDDVKYGNVSAARCLLIDDSLAVGNKLAVRFGPASTDGALKAGQFVTVRLWNGWQMVRLIEDLDTDSAGKGTLKFEPALRDGVLGGGPVVVLGPFLRATLDAPVSEAQLEPANFKGFSIDFLEDPTVLPGEVPQDTDLIWAWFADSLSLAPTIGTGTPTVTRAGATATYVDSDGLIKVAAANAPCFDFHPVTKAIRGLLIQSARTNYIWPSEDLTHARWVKTNTTITSNAVAGPDGAINLDRVVETAASGEHLLEQGLAAGAGSWAEFFHVKASGRTWCALVAVHVGDTGTTSEIHFNLSTGTKNADANGRITRASIEPLGDGLYKIGIVYTTTASCTTHNLRLKLLNDAEDTTHPGDTSLGLYAGYVQSEDGGVSTSYIPTAAAPVARNTDVATLATGLVPGFNAAQGTFVVEAILSAETAAAERSLAALGTDDSNIILHRRLPADAEIDAVTFDGGALQTDTGFISIAASSINRSAIGYQLNNYVHSVNGAATQTDVGASVPSLATLYIAQGAAGNRALNGHARRLELYKSRKPNRQVRSLSA